MTAPDGSNAEVVASLDATFAVVGPGTEISAFPTATVTSVTAVEATPIETSPVETLPDDLAAELGRLAAERGRSVDALLDAAALLAGSATTCRVELARVVLALAGRGDRRVVATTDLERLEARVELLEYRGKALTNALERVSFQPLDGGIRDVRDAAQLFGFANEWCFDEDRVRRRFRELAPVYHPDTGVVADRQRMTQLLEARTLLINHVRQVYASGQWVDRRRA